MKTKLWLVGVLSLVIIFLAGFVSAQSNEIPYAQETLTVGLDPVMLTQATYTSMATSALLTIEDPIIYTLDGTTPSSTVGHRADGQLRLNMYEIRSIKMITIGRIAANVATVHVTYYKRY